MYESDYKYCTFDEMTNILDLHGKKAVVIGAGSGIGLGITYGIAANGGQVVAADVDQKSLSILSKEMASKNGQVSTEICDVTSVQDVQNLYRKSVNKLGRIDIIYVVAGIDPVERIENFTYENFDRTIDVNLKGGFTVMKEMGTRMGEDFNSGSIVLIASSLTVRTEIGQGVYAATKAGLIQLARAFSAEMGARNIRVNVLAPGIVDTPMTVRIKNDEKAYLRCAGKSPLRRWALVRDVVGPALFLATDGASFINASVIFVDGGASVIDNRYDPGI